MSAFLVLLGSGAAGGCGSIGGLARPADEEAVIEAEFGHFDGIAVDSDPSKPDQTFVSSPDDARLIADAEAKLISQCMDRQGWPWKAAPSDPGEESVGTFGALLSPEQLRTNGYGVDVVEFATLGRMKDPADPNLLFIRSLPGARRAAYEKALFGGNAPDVTVSGPGDMNTLTASDGCIAQAEIEIFGSVANSINYSMIPEAVKDAAGSLRNNPVMVASASKWVECMRSAGYDPGFSVTGWSWVLAELSGGRPVTDAQARKVAAVDADCLETSGFWNTMNELMDQKSRVGAKKLGLKPEAWNSMRTEALANARQVLDTNT